MIFKRFPQLFSLCMLTLFSWGAMAQAPLDVSTPVGSVIYDMPENSWARLNTSTFESVWTPEDQRPSIGLKNVKSVIKAWSSMAWDSKRGKLMFFGGGHGNYAGNEVYLWNANTGLWERGALPSEVQAIDASINLYHTIDGFLNAPIAAHTYDNSEYLPLADRYISVGGAAFNTGGSWVYFNDDGLRAHTGPYLWDPEKANPFAVSGLPGSQVKPDTYPHVIGGEMWDNRNNVELIKPPKANGPGRWWGDGTSAYSRENPDADTIYFGDRFELYRLTIHDVDDASQDEWAKVGTLGESATGQGAGSYDSRLNIYVRTFGLQYKLDRSTFAYWDLNIPGSGKVLFLPDDPSGEFDFSSLEHFGMDYDYTRDRYILWDGGDVVWSLTAPEEVGTEGWTLTKIYDFTVDLSPTIPTKNVPDFVFNGILGKWKYIPAYDIYLGVNRYEAGEVWAYKPQSWDPSLGPLVDATPPKVTVSLPVESSKVSGVVTIEAEAIDDRYLEGVRFYVDDTEVGSSSSFPYFTSWNSSSHPDGNVSITAVAYDRAGNETSSVPVTLEVSNAVVVDVQPPTVEITQPQAGSEITGEQLVEVFASDDQEVAEVSLYADNVLVGTDSSLPFQFNWNSALSIDGPVNLIAYAYDTSGNEGVSEPVTVDVSNPGEPPPAGAPQILAPTAGSVLAGNTVSFSWTANGLEVGKWLLQVGTVPGGSDLFSKGLGASVFSVDVSGLPEDGRLIYARLSWRINGVVSTADYTYTAASEGEPPPPGVPAITSPSPGSTFQGSSQSFGWSTNGAVIDHWVFEIGSSLGSADHLYAELPHDQLTITSVGLPVDGREMYVRLSWSSDSEVFSEDYTYFAASEGEPPPAGQPGILSPADGATLPGSAETFEWDANGAAVTRWKLQVGSSPGGSDLFQKGVGSGITSQEVTGLPTDGSAIYVRLSWRVDGVIKWADYVYLASSPEV